MKATDKASAATAVIVALDQGRIRLAPEHYPQLSTPDPVGAPPFATPCLPSPCWPPQPPPLAQAYQAGDLILRAGAATVDAQGDSGDIHHALLDPVAGTGAILDSDTQLGLNFAYMLSEHLGVELLAATPFSNNVGVRGCPAPWPASTAISAASNTCHRP
jgi:hypothetical protein